MAVVDVPRAFLHAENKDDIVMFMKGKVTESMVMVAPQTYRKFITMEKRTKGSLCKSSEGTLWHAKECLTFLSKVAQGSRKHGF